MHYTEVRPYQLKAPVEAYSIAGTGDKIEFPDRFVLGGIYKSKGKLPGWVMTIIPEADYDFAKDKPSILTAVINDAKTITLPLGIDNEELLERLAADRNLLKSESYSVTFENIQIGIGSEQVGKFSNTVLRFYADDAILSPRPEGSKGDKNTH